MAYPRLACSPNKLLETLLNATGYYQAATTPGFWCQKCLPILFILIVNNFGIEYVGNRHIHHLRGTLKSHYTITEDWEGKKFPVINF